MSGLTKQNPVVIIAFEEEDNLGVRYIASVLIKAGFAVKILDFQLANRKILQKIKEFDPLIIGFSIIFQYHLPEFEKLIHYLRNQGINCHFSAGGQYPSLRPKDLFNKIPGLNSIVLFEGEYTFLELVESIYNENSWRTIDGICYLKNDSLVTNPLRKLERDLDNFPFPFRPKLMTYALQEKYATLIAGRGCYHNCTFCNTRFFYSKPPGPIKRIRRPEKVVEEMKFLYEAFNSTIFIFQDDDFPVGSKTEKNWVLEFCHHLKINGLSDKILWKINCRPDEVEEKSFQLMKDNGLFMAFLGIEDGTEEGLRRMNKKTSPQIAIHSIDILKKLNIKLNFGFILFQPSSTFESIKDNLKFLRKICADGHSPLSFLRMIPYFDTEIEKELRASGRLLEQDGLLKYNFFSPVLESYYEFVVNSFNEWLNHRYGLVNISKWISSYTSVYPKFHPITSEFKNMANTAQQVISKSNIFFIDTLEKLIDIFNGELNDKEKHQILEYHRIKIENYHKQYNSILKTIIFKLEKDVNYRLFSQMQ